MSSIKNKEAATFAVIKAVLDTIKEAGEAPAGTIYAGLMEHGCSLSQYQRIESIVLGTKLVTKSGDLLKWVGPIKK